MHSLLSSATRSYTERQTPQKPNYFVFIFGPVSEKKFKYAIFRVCKIFFAGTPVVLN